MDAYETVDYLDTVRLGIRDSIVDNLSPSATELGDWLADLEEVIEKLRPGFIPELRTRNSSLEDV